MMEIQMSNATLNGSQPKKQWSRKKLFAVGAIGIVAIPLVILSQKWNLNEIIESHTIISTENASSVSEYSFRAQLNNISADNNTKMTPIISQSISSSDSSKFKRSSGIICNPNRTVCIDPIGLDGTWVHIGQNNNRTFDSPECCGWGDKLNRDKTKKCNMNVTKYMLESKIEFGLHSGDANHPSLFGWDACECHNFVDKYEWQSPASTLPAKFNASETCRMLGNRTVLYIGDSTAHEAASTLMNAFRPMGNRTCHTQIYFALSDTLIKKEYGAMNRGSRWDVYVRRINPDIVILSVGAHIATNDITYLDLLEQVLGEMESMKKRRPNIKFAWQTQVPAGCASNITSPNNVTLAGEMSTKLSDHNHGRFYQRDLMLISRLEEIGMPFLDLRMLYSRTDAHINMQTGGMGKQKVPDCLHICVPGPLDVMGRLFHKLLVDFGLMT